ncbi:hypothetical protein BH20ACT13_BH20ACT13_08770 [soil metagenome]
MGPLVGGAVVDGISWQWIFWLNVPVGLVLLPLATQLRESTGPDRALDFPGLALASGGMALFFAPVANVVLSAVRPEEEGKASGANNAIREVGGVLGVAVLASVFARTGGYESPATFSDGLVPALWVGAIVVGIGSVLALLIPRKRPSSESLVSDPDVLAAPAAEAA